MNERTTSESPSFSVMTWNLFALPLTLNKDALQRMKRVQQALIKKPFKADIYCFQELFYKPAREEISSFLKGLGYEVFDAQKIAPFKSGVVGHSGLVTAIRASLLQDKPSNILQVKFAPFRRWPVSEDVFVRKGVLEVVIKLPSGRRLTILNTHTQAYANRLYSLVRKTQLQQIASLAHNSDADCKIVAGDFNVDRHPLTCGLFEKAEEFYGFARMLRLSQDEIPPLNFEPRGSDEARFSSIDKDGKKKPGLGKHPDHIFALGAKATNNTILNYREIVPKLGFLSDHLPVRASIHI